jgi:NAD(P)H-hydrate epimerase
LAHRGHRVQVVLAADPAQLRGEPAPYLEILRAAAVPVMAVRSEAALAVAARALRRADLVIDALLGIGLRGPVRPLQAALIERINRSGIPVLAVDVPSGLDADTGRALGPAVRAAATLTFGRPKRGLRKADGARLAGRISVDDLTIPHALFRTAGRATAKARA